MYTELPKALKSSRTLGCKSEVGRSVAWAAVDRVGSCSACGLQTMSKLDALKLRSSSCNKPSPLRSSMEFSSIEFTLPVMLCTEIVIAIT